MDHTDKTENEPVTKKQPLTKLALLSQSDKEGEKGRGRGRDRERERESQRQRGRETMRVNE